MLSQFVFVLKMQIKWSLWPFPRHEISVLIETIFGHPRYLLTDVPPQPNSPPGSVFGKARPIRMADGLNLEARVGRPLAYPPNK